jgi:hypothetical protein
MELLFLLPCCFPVVGRILLPLTTQETISLTREQTIKRAPTQPPAKVSPTANQSGWSWKKRSEPTRTQ